MTLYSRERADDGDDEPGSSREAISGVFKRRGPCVFWIGRIVGTAMLGLLVAGWTVVVWPSIMAPFATRHYWATSLESSVDERLLLALTEAVNRGAVGWLDVDPKFPIPPMASGVNLILYHVGGNCYIGPDCDRFPASTPTGDQWGDKERSIDLTDPSTRRLVIDDLVDMVQQGDRVAPEGSIVGVHIDNVHNLNAEDLAQLFNEYLLAVEVAKRRGIVSATRPTGYIAKNNPGAMLIALNRGLLHAPPLYQINENATLNEDGKLDTASRIARRIGRGYGIPVFLKTFGSDAAYQTIRDGKAANVTVSPDMTQRMAEFRYITGAAWSADESSYRPTFFAAGHPVASLLFPYRSRRAGF